MTLALLIALVTSTPDAGLVSCKSVGNCWLDAEGHAIARPKKLAGRPLPRGDCGKNLRSLRNKLECSDAGVCVATFVGDRC